MPAIWREAAARSAHPINRSHRFCDCCAAVRRQVGLPRPLARIKSPLPSMRGFYPADAGLTAIGFCPEGVGAWLASDLARSGSKIGAPDKPKSQVCDCCAADRRQVRLPRPLARIKSPLPSMRGFYPADAGLTATASQRPPPRSMNVPVEYDALSDSNHRIASATSSARPPRPMGMVGSSLLTRCASPLNAWNSVKM